MTSKGDNRRAAANLVSAAALACLTQAPAQAQPARAPEPLSPAFTGPLVGTYQGADGCRYEVTRSTLRLFLLNACTREWRAIRKLSDRVWSGSHHVASGGPTVFTVSFPEAARGRPQRMIIAPLSGPRVDAARRRTYAVDEVTFRSADGIKLAGSVLSPLGGGRRPALVLVHGSGPQDRYGDASVIDLLARKFVSAGYVVLQYDKRGVGGSGGDWRTASFRTMAEDALAGRALLMTRSDVDPSRVGVGGSSQAGWISAKAVEQVPAIPFVLLVGAGGSALNVQDQNAYNNGVNMRCAGIPQPVADKVIAQQRLYFRAEKDPSLRPELAAVTAALEKDERIAPWLMPATAARADPTQWFVAMETDFDPRPVWKAYRGRAVFAYGERDDQTPGSIAAPRVEALGNPNITVVTAPQSQHGGLLAEDDCHVGYDQVSRFDDRLWGPVDRWIAEMAVARPTP